MMAEVDFTPRTRNVSILFSSLLCAFYCFIERLLSVHLLSRVIRYSKAAFSSSLASYAQPKLRRVKLFPLSALSLSLRLL